MKKEFSTRGGAIIGSATLTWPFVKLIVSSRELIIVPSLKILFSGIYKYVFPCAKVASLEKRMLLPFLVWGVKINHFVPNLPQRIIFLCFANPDNLIRKIRQTGFLAAKDK